MVSSSEDPDSGPGTGDEAGENGRGKVDGSGQPSQPQQRSRVDRSQGEKISTERKIKITETCRETITTKGMHDLSSAINSLDDHFQVTCMSVMLRRIISQVTCMSCRAEKDHLTGDMYVMSC
ncbi:hypothetical protein C7M84_009928 [Penaeus vannamei]|uniref:Uncharacterized protein n=1 Tax=Penaeus vannamei TaxID=6689 RepID=A0A423T5E0_PENVA|nr:hypothetical protein C7M84_009928 [Penaeus vannamei]